MEANEFTEIRKSLGLNKVEFGFRLGISPPTLLSYERGQSPIPRTVTLAIAALCFGLKGCDATAAAASSLESSGNVEHKDFSLTRSQM